MSYLAAMFACFGAAHRLDVVSRKDTNTAVQFAEHPACFKSKVSQKFQSVERRWCLLNGTTYSIVQVTEVEQ